MQCKWHHYKQKVQKLNLKTGHVTDIKYSIKSHNEAGLTKSDCRESLVLAYRVGALLALCQSPYIPKLFEVRFITVAATTSVVAIQNVYDCYELGVLRYYLSNQRLITESGWQSGLLHNELAAVYTVYLCLLS